MRILLVVVDRCSALDVGIKWFSQQFESFQSCVGEGATLGLFNQSIGLSEQACYLSSQIDEYSKIHDNILIFGETGTEAEVIASTIHRTGPRRDGPFRVIKCAALTTQNFDEWFFARDCTGKNLVESVDGGTLFLENVTACSIQVQCRLLCVLQDIQRFTNDLLPRGIPKTRIISSSSCDLEEAMIKNVFSTDLYFWLDVVRLKLPPLRDRLDDVSLLFRDCVQGFADLYDVPEVDLTHDEIAVLLMHEWPGNITELRHVAKRFVLSIKQEKRSITNAISPKLEFVRLSSRLRSAVAEFEKVLIGKVLTAQMGRMDDTARELGIGRRTLNDKLVKLGLNRTVPLEYCDKKLTKNG